LITFSNKKVSRHNPEKVSGIEDQTLSGFYKGGIKNGKYNGYGILTQRDGTIY
jgi:hypothetical protein